MPISTKTVVIRGINLEVDIDYFKSPNFKNNYSEDWEITSVRVAEKGGEIAELISDHIIDLIEEAILEEAQDQEMEQQLSKQTTQEF